VTQVEARTEGNELTLLDVLVEHSRSRPTGLAMIDGDERFTYVEFLDRVQRLATGLRDRGVSPGDRVLWVGQNSARILELMLASCLNRAVFCPVNWRQSAQELAFVLDDLNPTIAFWQEDELGDVTRQARRERTSPDGCNWIQLDGEADEYRELLSYPPSGGVGDVHNDDVALLLYTAAFTGRPNGAMLSHRAIAHQDVLIAWMQGIDEDYVYLNCGPMFHMGTLMTTFATFHLGGVNVFTRRADPEEIARLIATEKCTGAFVRSPTPERIVELNAERTYDLSSLRVADGSPEWLEMVTLGSSLWDRRPYGYGQTELAGLGTFNALSPLGCQGASGRTSPFAQCRIIDEDGVEVPAGEPGEIAFRGPIVMNGYWNRPELNAERFTDGWYRTHDIGRREHDGSITFVSPKTRIIKSGAENVYPAEVEACLRLHPAVESVGVIGVPDPTWKQSVKAIIVTVPNVKVTEDDLVTHCRDRIASYKKPKLVEFVAELPMVGAQPDYDELDRLYGGGGYPGAGS
jgi:acyl-CoA synthetase (AMP-forming)/AMP-acid ligase II